MKSFACFLSAALLLAATAAHAQTVPSVVVAKPIKDVVVPVGTSVGKVNLKKTFAIDGSPGDVVHVVTTLGNVDVQLLANDAPATVANFLNYVNRQDYNTSFLHRSVPGFVVQGGGFKFLDDQVVTIPTDPPVVNEFKNSNLRGTVAMAKLGGDPNSATDQFFFNLADNSGNLDNQNGGFAVFGQVVKGLEVVDAIAALTVVNAGGNFDQLPVVNFSPGGDVNGENLVFLNSVAVLPLVPKVQGDPALLKLKVFANSNPGLVTPSIYGNKLTLTYAPGVTGTAVITVQAKGPNKGEKARASFNVTVQ